MITMFVGLHQEMIAVVNQSEILYWVNVTCIYTVSAYRGCKHWKSPIAYTVNAVH